jgi:putative zinc finger protein
MGEHPERSRGAVSDERWHDSLRAVGRTKGECPSTELLAKFLEGDLAGEDSAEITSHLASCGICDSLVERMRRFDDPEAWQEADRRLAQRFDRFLSRQRPLVLSILSGPWLAYAMALLLIYPAYRGLVRRPIEQRGAPPSSGPAGLASAKVLQLDATRSAGGSEVALTERDKVFILAFFVPIRNGLRYSAEIVNPAGRIIAAQPEIASYDGRGNFYLVCARQQFISGQYVLTVKESGGANREFRFQFGL